VRLDDLPAHLQAVAAAQLKRERATPRDPALSLGAEDPRADEKRTQADCVAVVRALGGKAWTTSQARAAKMTPGLPDCWFAFPQHAFACWWETKRPDGGAGLSADQLDFAEACDAGGVPYGAGSREALEGWLVTLGIAVRDPAGHLEPTRPTKATLPASPIPHDLTPRPEK